MLKLAIALLFNGLVVLSSASVKANLFPKNFSKNYNIGDLGISLPVFLSRTNWKLHNISVTPEVKKVITSLSSQEYPVNAGAPQGYILGLTLFLLYNHDLLDNVICNIYVDDNTLYSKCDQTFDLWQKLEVASELKPDLQDTVV